MLIFHSFYVVLEGCVNQGFGVVVGYAVRRLIFHGFISCVETWLGDHGVVKDAKCFQMFYIYI